MKAIETRYRGYRFRSRLEARWAVFFDNLGFSWKYEHEGFDLGEHGWYLPDFWVDELSAWVEIKPDVLTKLEEYEGVIKPMALAASGENVLLLAGDPYPGRHVWRRLGWHTMMVYEAPKHLGEDEIVRSIDGDSLSIYAPPMTLYFCRKCRKAHWFSPFNGPMTKSSYDQETLAIMQDMAHQAFGHCRNGCDPIPPSWSYNAARGARFEHGEKPGWFLFDDIPRHD